MSRTVYEFGPFRLDLGNRLLLRGAVPVALTPKSLEVLAALVERAGEVLTREDLLTRVWADTFIEEGNLTQTVYMLRRALEAEGGTGEAIQTVPRRGYRFAAPVRRLAPEEPARTRRGGGEPLVLAVLPLEPLAAGPDDEYLGLGMADALITRLSNLRRLRVRPTSAVREYTGHARDAVAAGRRLQADLVLDGTLQRSGRRLRINVQLISVRDGAPLWAEAFDSVAEGLFDLQDSISRRLARELAGRLGHRDKLRLSRRATGDPEAYQAYIKATFFWNKRTEEGFHKALELFREALARDPAYAPAQAGIATCYLLLPLYGGMPSTEAFPKATAAALRALELDPDLAEAHTGLAYARFFYDRDCPAAEAAFRRALALDPGYPTAHQWYAYFLAAHGRHVEAVAEAEQALALDPLSLVINTDLGLVLFFARRYEAAVVQLRRALELDPGFAYAHFGLGHAFLQLGRGEEAVAELRRAVELSGRASAMLGNLGLALGLAGHAGEAREVLAELADRARTRHVEAAHFAFIHLGLGDSERAVELLSRAADERSRFVVFLAIWPIYDPLRDLPGWDELLRRVGMPGR